ncbi:hypothetical protein H6P81_007449 [Aristolochia fimbriata]|uniref:Glycoprotease 1 n=1 Tax=Aristolochia fimbriata TaxID=158543 RepID=A0AAV7F097_ARIFI|nr:hypothetical protein H6P81_007449 [Aristolochia fimbriata]
MLVCSVFGFPGTFSRVNLIRVPSLRSAFIGCLRQKHLAASSPHPISFLSKCFYGKLAANPTFTARTSPRGISDRITGVGDDLLVLGIETSCDDTAAAVVRSNGDILGQVVSSQADLLAQFGGVAPKMAEEAHAKVIDQVVQQALEEANVKEGDLSAVAVTIGPGLSLCLRVGVSKARKIARNFCLPFVGVHHMEAHALVARLMEKDLQFPFLALLISGGHNLLILAHDLGHYVQLGTTIDDAVGEAYDKVARWLGLDIRKGGGPALEALALEGNADAIKFSIPMKQHKDCNFSYAGLKTQVRLSIQSHKINSAIPISSVNPQERSLRADIAASFQRVAVSHLEERCERAIEWALEIEPTIKCLVVSGGVASNKYVRARLDRLVGRNGLKLVCPPPSLCTDNGVMVAWTGLEHYRLGRFDDPPPADEPEDTVLDLRPRWPLGEELIKGRSQALTEDGIPNPLDQEPPPDPVHVVGGPIFGVEHLARVGSPAAGAVNPLAEVGDLGGERRVLAGVPGVDEGIGGELGELVGDDAHHPVDADVPVGGFQGLDARNVGGDGEGVGADARALFGGIPDPGVGQGVSDDGREGEVMEAADLAAEVLDVDVVGGEEDVKPAPGIDGQGTSPGGDGAPDDGLDGEAGEGFAVGVEPVVLLLPEAHGPGDVRPGLVRVEPDGLPPPGDGGAPGAGGGDGGEEGPDDALLGGLPLPVPDRVEGDVRGQDRAHVFRNGIRVDRWKTRERDEMCFVRGERAMVEKLRIERTHAMAYAGASDGVASSSIGMRMSVSLSGSAMRAIFQKSERFSGRNEMICEMSVRKRGQQLAGSVTPLPAMD